MISTEIVIGVMCFLKVHFVHFPAFSSLIYLYINAYISMSRCSKEGLMVKKQIFTTCDEVKCFLPSFIFHSESQNCPL